MHARLTARCDRRLHSNSEPPVWVEGSAILTPALSDGEGDAPVVNAWSGTLRGGKADSVVVAVPRRTLLQEAK